jgi:CelD/BcsL family acetyltransferase involved in cellulose biosynthesis
MTNAANLAPSITGTPVVRFVETSVSAASVASVRVVRSLAEVEEIRDVWSAWPSHRDSDIDFCLSFSWARAEVIRPHLIVVYRDGQPQAMLVGRLENTRMASKIGYLRLPGIPSRVLSFSYGGLLGDPSDENCDEIIRSIMASLREGEADVAVLDHPRIGSFLRDGTLRASGFATRDRLPKPALHHVMKLPEDIKDVYPALSGNHRADLKRKAKKLMADHQGNVKVRCYREPAELEHAIPQIEQIAQKTYQRGLGVGFQDNDEMRRRLRLCADKGWLRIYVLYLGDTPCAFWIGTLYHGSFCSDYLAFDPRFGAYSPGTFLLMKVLEEFCGAGVREVDFGFGEGRYKEQFGNSPSMEASVFVFAPKAKGILLNGMRTSTGLTENLARRIVERTNLLPRIKKLWRSRLAKKTASE